ncbi:hypothetical protein Pmani_003296 [Petrolisthes manimaculis]|uniref:Uncharacterized protein n=1 Tax=Petrolisthes manimaculis TaxID=1843537 RepID=A0AAE1UPI5_9EUCA|nr:hypothetical protein Pmani_003296 [Petrolisthes manimaculis]
MADPQTDWEVCGQRRSRAHRVAELVALREEQRQVALDRRRTRLRALLEEEEARLQHELQLRVQHYQQQEFEDRQQVATATREKEEEARLKQVEVADEQRRREASHQYREEYWRQVQRYINETRPLDIALRNHIRNTYGLQVKRH